MPLHATIILTTLWSCIMYFILIAFVTTFLTEVWSNIFYKSGFKCLTPSYLHKETRLNWFGAIFIGIILHIIYLPIIGCWYLSKLFIKKETK